MKWITREKVKVDRVACPWLIKKFIDPQAQFVFLPSDTDWSKIKDGVVYDVPNCELGHHGEPRARFAGAGGTPHARRRPGQFGLVLVRSIAQPGCLPPQQRC